MITFGIFRYLGWDFKIATMEQLPDGVVSHCTSFLCELSRRPQSTRQVVASLAWHRWALPVAWRRFRCQGSPDEWSVAIYGIRADIGARLRTEDAFQVVRGLKLPVFSKFCPAATFDSAVSLLASSTWVFVVEGAAVRTTKAAFAFAQLVERRPDFDDDGEWIHEPLDLYLTFPPKVRAAPDTYLDGYIFLDATPFVSNTKGVPLAISVDVRFDLHSLRVILLTSDCDLVVDGRLRGLSDIH